MKREFLVLTLVLLVATNSMAQEVIKGFNEKKDLPYLNKILRRSVRRLNAIENGVSLTSGVTGILSLLNGGTGSALTDPGSDKIGFWDDSAGIFTWLTVGSGLLISTTTLSNDSGFLKLSTTTFTADTNTGDIPITSGRRYRVYLRITAASAGITALDMRFDSDSTATDYAWNLSETEFDTSPSATLTGDDSDAEIQLGDLSSTSVVNLSAIIDIDANPINNYIFVHGEIILKELGGKQAARTLHGIYKDAGTLTDFEFLSASGNITGNVILYELN